MATKLWTAAAGSVAALSLVGPAAAATPAFDHATILVKFAVPAQAPAIVRSLGDRPLGLTLNGVEVVRLGRGERVRAKIARYRALRQVVYAEPNFLAKAQLSSPNDPQFASQWAWGPLRAVDGWSVYPGAYGARTGATIAIVDTGVDSTHPDLSDGRVLTTLGANCVTESGSCSPSPALDDNGHGTHVAGIAAAATNNGVGVAGTAFGAQLIPVKVLDSSASGTYAAATNGILWAVQHGARAINLSLGGSSYSQTLCDAVSEAIDDGAVVIASAGNGSTSAANYPAACPGAIGVAATDSSDHAASFSNYGSPDVFVSAPGVSIYSTYRGGSYATMSGTSMAAPFVTGLAALLLGQRPSRSVGDVKTILAETADKVGGGYGADPYGTCSGCTWSSAYGYGRIDLYNALAAGPASLQVSLSPATATSDITGIVTYAVTLSGSVGTAGLSVSGLPAGASATFAPPTTTVPGASRLLVRVPPGTSPGTYGLTVTARSGSVVATASATLVVPAADFALAVSPDVRYATAGLTAAYTISVTSQGGFTGLVDLAVAGLPPGATVVLQPDLVSAPGVAALTVLLAPVTPAGSYTFTVTGSSGAVVHQAQATLIVK